MNDKPVDKMTKKERKEYFKKFRNTWKVNPITRREGKDKYKNRKEKEKADEKQKCD